MKGRLRQGVYPMGVRMSLEVSLYQALGIHTYVYLRAATVSAEIFGHIILHYDYVFCACMHVCIVSFCFCGAVAHFKHSGWMEHLCGVPN